MNSCEVCSAECEEVYCLDCTYRIESGNNDDIWQRVQDFDNSEYQIDEIKIAICQLFGITEMFTPGRKQPQTTARGLFYYMLHTRLKMRVRDICQLLNVDHCIVIYNCKKWLKRFESETARKKYESILNL